MEDAHSPQFGDILMRQNTSGKSQYHAAILKLETRLRNGWGGRVNYTYSRLEDNFFAETNTYSTVNQSPQNSYDVAREYARSILDVPHKLVVSPIVELPFGEGRRWANSGYRAASHFRMIKNPRGGSEPWGNCSLTRFQQVPAARANVKAKGKNLDTIRIDRHASRGIRLGLAVCLLSGAAVMAATAYESPPTLRASELARVSCGISQGPHRPAPAF